MQMYSLFDVDSIILSTVDEISETPEKMHYRRVQVKHKDGIALITLYSTSKDSLAVYPEENE